MSTCAMARSPFTPAQFFAMRKRTRERSQQQIETANRALVLREFEKQRSLPLGELMLRTNLERCALGHAIDSLVIAGVIERDDEACEWRLL